jgi:hypothetical protein
MRRDLQCAGLAPGPDDGDDFVDHKGVSDVTLYFEAVAADDSVLLSVSLVIFTMLYFTPGNPAELLLPVEASEADIAAMEQKTGTQRSLLYPLF